MSPKSFGEKVAEIRNRKKQMGYHMSIRDCANRAGMSPGNWGRIERWSVRHGTHAVPRRDTVKQIALGLEEPYEALLELAGFNPNEIDVDSVQTDMSVDDSAVALARTADKLHALVTRMEEGLERLEALTKTVDKV